MRLTRTMCALLFAAGIAAGTAAAAQAKTINIVMVTHGQASDAFWTVVKNGAIQAAKDAGVHFTYRAPPTFDMVAMGQLITAAVNQHPDGLIVSIPDADALGRPIKAAVAAGIPVISINSGADVSKQLGALLHIGQEEYAAGHAAGAKLAELGGTKGVCINHEVGNVGLDQRCKGFADGFAHPVKVLPTSNDPTDVQAKLSAALQSDPAIDTVLALNAGIAGEAAVATLAKVGAAKKIHLASFDLSPGFLAAVARGDADFAIDQQQYLQGYLSVSFMALDAKYGLIPASNVSSGPNLITKDKASQVIALAKQAIR